jgi:hypothetical protein
MFKIIRLIFLITITSACPLRSLDLLNRPIIIINSTQSINNYDNSDTSKPYRSRYNSDFKPSRVEDFGFNLDY